MSATDTGAAFPYATYLDITFDPLKLIDVPSLVQACTDQWYNQTLCKVNDSVVRLGVMQGEYHWHKHDNDDEFFFVLGGTFIIDLEGRSVALSPQQGFVEINSRCGFPIDSALQSNPLSVILQKYGRLQVQNLCKLNLHCVVFILSPRRRTRNVRLVYT